MNHRHYLVKGVLHIVYDGVTDSIMQLNQDRYSGYTSKNNDGLQLPIRRTEIAGKDLMNKRNEYMQSSTRAIHEPHELQSKTSCAAAKAIEPW